MKKYTGGPSITRLTVSRGVGDGENLPSELVSLDLLDEFPGIGDKALDASVLPVGYAQLLPVGQVGQAVGDKERDPFPSV